MTKYPTKKGRNKTCFGRWQAEREGNPTPPSGRRQAKTPSHRVFAPSIRIRQAMNFPCRVVTAKDHIREAYRRFPPTAVPWPYHTSQSGPIYCASTL